MSTGPQSQGERPVPPTTPKLGGPPELQPSDRTPAAGRRPRSPKAGRAVPPAPLVPRRIRSSANESGADDTPTSYSPAGQNPFSFFGAPSPSGDQPSPALVKLYKAAGRRYHVPWQVLAAINWIETDFGRDLSTSSAGALGWMQFMPGTWAEFAVDADGHDQPSPYDPADAIYSAAHYLAANGATHDLRGAIFAYNHADWYVNEVLAKAQTMYDPTTFSALIGGAHARRLIHVANQVSDANFPYLWGGGHEQPARFEAFDCSGAVSYLIQQAGYNVPTATSGEIGLWGFPAGPGAVTIFYNATHTFMRIGNRYWGTSGFARPGGGAGWFDQAPDPAYLAGFAQVHVPGLYPVQPHAAHRAAHRSRHRHLAGRPTVLISWAARAAVAGLVKTVDDSVVTLNAHRLGPVSP